MQVGSCKCRELKSWVKASTSCPGLDWSFPEKTLPFLKKKSLNINLTVSVRITKHSFFEFCNWHKSTWQQCHKINSKQKLKIKYALAGLPLWESLTCLWQILFRVGCTSLVPLLWVWCKRQSTLECVSTIWSVTLKEDVMRSRWSISSILNGPALIACVIIILKFINPFPPQFWGWIVLMYFTVWLV